MNKVSREAIEQLLETESNATLSLYLPTHRFPSSQHITEDKIRFKNLIKSGKEKLSAYGIDDANSRQIVNELESGIFNSKEFWQHATEGLAVFCSPAGTRYFHLPIECDEYVSVGDRYAIAPLLIATSFDMPYNLLALSIKNPVLFHGDMYGVERVAVDLPVSPEEALNIDELYSNSKTFRDRGSEPGHPGAKSHGQGDARQAGREERLKFFRLIDDKILSSKDVDISLPILLAGTDDEVSSYRQLSCMKHVLAASLKGNHTGSATHDIHTRSWPLIAQELCDPERASAVEKISSLLGTGRASTDVVAVTAAAAEGRVDTLLLGMLAKTMDSVSDAGGTVMKLVFPDKYGSDKIGKSVRAVFDQGGRAIGIIRDTMPGGAIEAALFRY